MAWVSIAFTVFIYGLGIIVGYCIFTAIAMSSVEPTMFTDIDLDEHEQSLVELIYCEGCGHEQYYHTVPHSRWTYVCGCGSGRPGFGLFAGKEDVELNA